MCDRLDDEYGLLEWRSHGEPLGALVATILSQHTSDRNSERAFDNLRRAFPTWDAVREAPVGEIADAIRAGGLADAKAPRIKSVLEAIHERRGETSLDFLGQMPTDEARAYLLEFYGVGPKTMACVMMFSLCRPVLPVDTHVFRVSQRLGLARGDDPDEIHDQLVAVLPRGKLTQATHRLIIHGRRTCLARKPACPVCPVRTLCPWPDKTRS